MNQRSLTRLLQGLLLLLVLAMAAIVALRYETVSVLVLRTKLAAGDTIAQANLVGYSVPAAGAFDYIRDEAKLVGQKVAVDLPAGTPIVAAMLATGAASAADTNPGLRLVGDATFPQLVRDDLPKLRYPFPVSQAQLSGGAVKAGNWVNISATTSGSPAVFVIQKVHVVAVMASDGTQIAPAAASTTAAGGSSPLGGTAKKAPVPATIILALTQEQVGLLTAYDAKALTYSPVAVDAALLPGVPVGLSSMPTTAPGASAAPSAAPSAVPATSAPATSAPATSVPSTPAPSASTRPSASATP